MLIAFRNTTSKETSYQLLRMSVIRQQIYLVMPLMPHNKQEVNCVRDIVIFQKCILILSTRCSQEAPKHFFHIHIP